MQPPQAATLTKRPIVPGIAHTRWILSALTLIWNAAALPCLVWLAHGYLTTGARPDLVLAFFAAAGPAVAVYWLVSGASLRRLGPMPLEMDPFPGSLGGELGGAIDWQEPFAQPRAFDVSLTCIKVSPRRGGQGASAASQDILWQDQVQAFTEPGPTGSRLRFVIAVPDHLPASSDPGFDGNLMKRPGGFAGIKWMVRIRASQGRLERSYTVPVVPTAHPLRMSNRPAAQGRPAAPRTDWQPIAVAQTPEGLRLFCPRRRFVAEGLLCLTVAGVGLGIGLSSWLARTDWAAGQTAVAIFIGFVACGFMAVGAAFLLGVGYFWGNTLETVITGATIKTIRRVWGIGFSRELPIERVTGIDSRIKTQLGSTEKAVLKYTLYAASSGGKPLALADGIKGTPAAKALADLVSRACGRHDDKE